MNLKDLFNSIKPKIRHLTYNEYQDWKKKNPNCNHSVKFKSGDNGKVFEVEVKENEA